ncbi:hypothetical protein NU10_11945 [Flavobacterium dauae]|uniref:hypothetical protein n=1 Tax=Flavobacterium dauae TaxID=1563479 RepID=UPI00101B4205|nr:hypothetical protein [Flavobacterium dauae]WLD23413.1 hypothetical protein NU10_11945 [Flavobacterium dauae]
MNSNFLFPSKFKYLAIILFLIPVFCHLFDIVLLNNDLVEKTLFEFLVSCAFFLIVFSRYKDDDEMLYSIRLKTTVYSLLVGVFLLIGTPLWNYILWNQEYTYESAGGIIMTVLFFNTLFFFRERSKLKEVLEDEK